MHSEPKDSFTYVLLNVTAGEKFTDKDIFYIGKTNDAEDTMGRHRAEGKVFKSFLKTSVLMTSSDAYKKETKDLADYYIRNTKLPYYQKDNNQERQRVQNYLLDLNQRQE